MGVNNYTISPTIVSENFDNEVIIVNMSRGHYYSLRDSSFHVWQGLESGLSPDALLDYLARIYDVDTETIHQPVWQFLGQLEAEGLILTGTPATHTPPPTFHTGQSFSVPTLEVYTDMADLLALDPIHDVSPVDGWPIKK